MTDTYCSMIHGGLHLDFKHQEGPIAKHCCLRNSGFKINPSFDFWTHKQFQSLRELNSKGIWDPECSNCEQLEKIGHTSFRLGSNLGLGIYKRFNLPGPSRIDLNFDISCNLACRTCSTHSSTFWQKHLKEHGEWNLPIFTPRYGKDVIKALEKLDLSNLKQIVLCGGETLLGQDYWDVVGYIVEKIQDRSDQLTIGFQTNGTQPINPRNFHIIESIKEVILHISLDGISKKFEYLRWPAKWDQVVDNIFYLRDHGPRNLRFLIEETVSIFNVYYTAELENWAQTNFNQDRNNGPIDHTKHLANGIFSLESSSQELVDALRSGPLEPLVPAQWKEDPERIQRMISEIKKFDGYRGESFGEVFPELREFYTRFW